MSNPTPSDAQSSKASQGARSLLSAGSKITGDLAFPGLVEVLGRIDGQLSADSVVIGEQGEVEGSIKAKTIAIKGKVNGEITGGSVTLHTGAHVSGEITYQQLVVETGAAVDGGIHKAETGGST
ncbi:polymer-forming cytoskeletal protein [Rhodobacteraceae bacterium M382]|nr:polymer-forming cytoskeletal protein [Rhodobacteraceae bacterium M382]